MRRTRVRARSPKFKIQQLRNFRIRVRLPCRRILRPATAATIYVGTTTTTTTKRVQARPTAYSCSIAEVSSATPAVLRGDRPSVLERPSCLRQGAAPATLSRPAQLYNTSHVPAVCRTTTRTVPICIPTFALSTRWDSGCEG